MEPTDKEVFNQVRDALGSHATSTPTTSTPTCRRCGDLPTALRQAKPVQCRELAKGIVSRRHPGANLDCRTRIRLCLTIEPRT
jgi:hypothetical protein